MAAIGCLVPELRNEEHGGRKMQIFKKTQCFYVATVNFNTIMLCKLTRVVKKQLGSRQRRLGKTAVVKAGAYIVSIDRKTTVYGLEAYESRFLKNTCQLSIATRSRIWLTTCEFELISSL